MPIQPRAPSWRENSRSKPPQESARFELDIPPRASRRNSRTSARSDCASGGSSHRSKLKVGMDSLPRYRFAAFAMAAILSAKLIWLSSAGS